MNIQEKINEHIHRAAEDVRAYVKSNLKYWRALPYFCLWTMTADQAEGYSGRRILRDKLYFINFNSMSVNLLTGDIIDVDGSLSADNDLLQDFQKINDCNFDGECIFSLMNNTVKRNKYNINAKWRQKMIKKYNIETPKTILLLL